MNNTLTCVYCGHEYPEGTPPHGSKILTDHIKVCEKHPMREAEFKIALLRKALAEVVGASTKEDLDALEVGLRILPGVDSDKIAALNAVDVLRKTL